MSTGTPPEGSSAFPVTVAERRQQFNKHATVPDLTSLMRERFGDYYQHNDNSSKSPVSTPRSCHRANTHIIIQSPAVNADVIERAHDGNISQYSPQQQDHQQKSASSHEDEAVNINSDTTILATLMEHQDNNNNDCCTPASSSDYILLEEVDKQTGIRCNAFILPLVSTLSPDFKQTSTTPAPPADARKLSILRFESNGEQSITTGETANTEEVTNDCDGSKHSDSTSSTIPIIRTNPRNKTRTPNKEASMKFNTSTSSIRLSVLTPGANHIAQTSSLITDYSSSADSTSIMSDITDMSLIRLACSSPSILSPMQSPLPSSYTSDSFSPLQQIDAEPVQRLTSERLAEMHRQSHGNNFDINNSSTSINQSASTRDIIPSSPISTSLERTTEHKSTNKTYLIPLKVKSDEFSDVEDDDYYDIDESKSDTTEFQEGLHMANKSAPSSSLLSIYRSKWRSRTRPSTPSTLSPGTPPFAIMCSPSPDGRMIYTRDSHNPTMENMSSLQSTTTSTTSTGNQRFTGIREGFIYRMGSHGKDYYKVVNSDKKKKESNGLGFFYNHRPYTNRKFKRRAKNGAEGGCGCNIM